MPVDTRNGGGGARDCFNMGILQGGFSKWGSERGWVGVRRDYSHVLRRLKEDPEE
jgi:hypothetical protein